eukprot:gene12378-26035_t
MDGKRTTPRYRKVGRDSNVDESLFISKGHKTATNNASNRNIGIPANAVVIGRYELEQIKNAAIIKTDAEIIAERERTLTIKEENERKARERKQRMIMLEEEAKKHTKKSDVELEEEAKRDVIRKMAQNKIQEDTQLNKMIQTLTARAAAFTIRDQQIADKRRLEEDEAEYEKRMDLIMELDRLKDLKRREDEDAQKRVKRVEARQVIMEQIDVRQRSKLLQAEAREQENVMMRSTMKKYEDEDKNIATRKQAEIERSKIEVFNANAEAIMRKKEAKVREKHEVEEILRYQAMKDAELARREEDEKLLDRQKKERQAKLLAMQERSQNKQAEVDELRARRAEESREREARRREREDAEKKRIEMSRVMDDRSKQAEAKREREEIERRMTENEFRKTLEYSESQSISEQREALRKKEAAKHHRDQVQKQIEEAEMARKRERAQKFEEGAKLREVEVRQLAELAVMKDHMLKNLEGKGIDPVYLTEMKNLDVRKLNL